MIIYQILGKARTRYSEVCYRINDKVYQARLSSEALCKHNDKIEKIVLLKPESIKEDADESVESANTTTNIDIKIIQAVGVYDNIRYNGTPSSVSLQIFADMLRRSMDMENKENKVIVDLSTGYNLYVLSLLEAARFYTTYMRLTEADLSKIFVDYAISEPVSPGGYGPYEIYTEKLETRTTFDPPIKDGQGLTTFIEDISNDEKAQIGNEFSNLNSKVRQVQEMLKLFYNAIRYNAPLFLFTISIDFDKAKAKNQDIISELCRFVEDILNKRKRLKRELYKVFLNIAMYNGILKRLRDLRTNNYNNGIPLNTLKKFQALYKDLDIELNWRFLEREIYEIELYKEYLSDKWKVYKDIRESALGYSLTNNKYAHPRSNSSKKNEKSSDIKRNFFAHAGLSYDTLELRCVEGDILCKYREDKINEIKSWIKNPE